MNKLITKNILLLILPVCLSGFVIACSTTHHQESTGQFIDSSVITTRVKAELIADKQVKSLPITVKTYKNVVQLSGFVDNKAQEIRAISIAKSVEGVIGVEDSLIIKHR